MKKRIAWLFLAASAAATLSSCIIAVVDTSDPAGMRGWGEFRRVVPFRSGGTIMLENARGDVEIFGWDRNEAEVVARHEGRTPKPGFAWYGSHRWYEPPPGVAVDSLDDVLKIRTRGDERGESGVAYRINVPMSVNIDSLRCREGNVLISGVYGRAVIAVQQGDVRVENYSGSLDITLGRGKTEAELLDLRRGDDIKITVAAGDIVVLLEDEVSARVEAAASKIVDSEFDLGQKPPAAKVKGQVKDGQAMIALTAVQGGIELKKTKK